MSLLLLPLTRFAGSAQAARRRVSVRGRARFFLDGFKGLDEAADHEPLPANVATPRIGSLYVVERDARERGGGRSNGRTNRVMFINAGAC